MTPSSDELERLAPCPFCDTIPEPYETMSSGEWLRHPVGQCGLSDYRFSPAHINWWNTRTDTQETITLRARVAELERLGRPLATLAFNLKQRDTLTSAERDILHVAQTEWDTALQPKGAR